MGAIGSAEPWPPPQGPYFRPKFFYFLRPPVVVQGDMVIGRYYPTVMPLMEDAAEFSPNLLVNGASAPNQVIEAGLNMVLGGPQKLNTSTGSAIAGGNEVWEVIPSDTTSSVPWEPPFIPENPTATDPDWKTWTVPNGPLPGSPGPAWDTNSPHYTETDPDGQLFGEPADATYDTYPRLPGENYPDRLFDSYPRAFQLTGGEILVCGDVNTSAFLNLGQTGATWVIDPDYQEANENRWESWRGPIALTGQVGGGAWHDSFYDSVVLLQTLTEEAEPRIYRVLMFGGSRDKDPPNDDWQPNTEMWEFNPNAGSPQPLFNGSWHMKKADPEFGRVFANAVVLPTGEVFIVGGSYEDDHEGGAGHSMGATMPTEPVIYDPGPDQDAAGTLYENDTVVPHVVAGTTTNILLRTYHSVALLLPDGRVMVAGGKRKYTAAGALEGLQLGADGLDPRYSAQIFSPPYLDLQGNGFVQRPVIESVDSPLFFGTQFSLTVIRDEDSSHEIDRVVLIRPGALTHHFDQDQRYMELEFTSSGPVASGGDFTETLTVMAPGFDELPAGWYMIFAVERDTQAPPNTLGYRVPTVGEFVRIK